MKIRALVFLTIALFPCVAFSETKPPEILPSIGATVSTIFVGLLVVVVGYAIYTGIIKALRGMGWYEDPTLTAIHTGLGEICKAITTQASTINNITGVVSDLANRLRETQTLIQNQESSHKLLADEFIEIKKIDGRLSDLLNHEDYGNRKLWDILRGINETDKETCRHILQAVGQVKDDTTSIKTHISNEVFKERQSKAFDTIYQTNDTIKRIAKAVQTDDLLPMGQTTPMTFCQHETVFRKVEKLIYKMEAGIKEHRADLDKEVTSTLGTLLVLIEQLVKRAERMEIRIRDLGWTSEDDS